MKINILILLAFCCVTCAASPEFNSPDEPYNVPALKLPGIFCNRMILQQNTLAPIWGWDIPNETITITASWDNVPHTTVADENGQWTISDLQTPTASLTEHTITVSGSKTITFTDVVTGEVWLASGQSNMEMRLNGSDPVEGNIAAISNAGGKNIRFINIPRQASYRPETAVSANWEKATPSNVGNLSAVAWFFVDALHAQLPQNTPIGIINSSFGGTHIEAWMSSQMCKELNILHEPESDKPVSGDWDQPTVFFNAMMHPIKGYAIKGMIWYQGEDNIDNYTKYVDYMKRFVAGYRSLWNCGDFPFYYAQIAPYKYGTGRSPYLREAQLNAMKEIAYSGMAVLLDIGVENNIHPPKKKEVGDRLAGLALENTYGKSDVDSESPVVNHIAINGNTVTLTFDKNLAQPTDITALTVLFEVAGADNSFKIATSLSVSGNTVSVSSSSVTKPVKLRYAFTDWTVGRLFGTNGLPVSSFRAN
jgi:sialate O-acetylesterase